MTPTTRTRSFGLAAAVLAALALAASLFLSTPRPANGQAKHDRGKCVHMSVFRTALTAEIYRVFEDGSVEYLRHYPPDQGSESDTWAAVPPPKKP